ncbi:hypothetical protein HY04_03495 [Kaistella antarctica]|nr:hypothetical protein HY04_03495 [Kaistella antarctica]
MGPDQIQVGERQNYTAEISADPTANHYEWIYLDQKMIPQSDLNQNILTVKGSVPGKSVLSLKIKAAGKTFNCKKSVEVIAPLSVSLDINAQKCDIEIEAFKEIRVSNTIVAFEAIAADNSFTYQWTIHYRNGSKKISNDKVGKFDYSNENVIDQVDLDITDKKCTKKISKTYNHNFWYFF